MGKTKTQPKKYTEADLLALLAKKHNGRDWAFLSHVRNSTGFGRRVRTADALAMSTWPSRGLELHGFEVKVARGDWLKELKSPEKADPIAKFCHRWWVVASPGIVEIGELPPDWGLLEPQGRALHAKKLPEKREAEAPTHGLLASILRNASESMIAREAVKAELDARYEAGKVSGGYDAKLARDNLARLKKQAFEFEKASGIKMGEYDNGERIGAAVKFVLGIDGGVAGQVRRARVYVKQLLDKMDEVIEQAAIVKKGD